MSRMARISIPTAAWRSLPAGLNIAVGASSTGTVNITGNATLHNELQTNLGLSGQGTLNITSGSFTTTDAGTANPAPFDREAQR